MNEDEERAVLERRAARLARPPDRATQGVELLVAMRAGERYAWPLARVAEVIGPPLIAALPGAAAHLVGILSRRGEPIPVFDLRVLFGGARDDLRAGGLVVVLRGVAAMGLVVDRIEGIVVADPASARTPRSGDATALWIERIHADGTAVIDVEAMLADPRFVLGDADETEVPR